MDNKEPSTFNIDAINENMRTALADTTVSLPVELLKEWLKVMGISYKTFSEQIGSTESTIKNWLSTQKQIPIKKEKKVRAIIQCILASAEGASFCLSPIPENRWTYTMSPDLHSILTKISKWSYKTVEHTISNALYNWIGTRIQEGALERSLSYKDGLGSTISNAKKVEKALYETLQNAQNKLDEFSKSKKALQYITSSNPQVKTLLNKTLALLEASIKSEEETIEKIKEILEIETRFISLIIKEAKQRPSLQQEALQRSIEMSKQKKHAPLIKREQEK